MTLKRSLQIVAFALPVFVLLLGCSAVNKGAGVSSIPTIDRTETTGEGQIAPALSPSLSFTSSQLRSVDTPITTVTDTLATAMIAMLPYSDTLLYSPISWHSPEFRFVETSVSPDLERKITEVVNQGETFRAFTACNPDLCHERIFVENLSTGQVFDIQFSGYMAWRPITQMGWLNNDVLLFTHPSQPSYGYRYAVNVSKQRFLLAILVTDECFVYGKCD
jgi:hypothetical protein